MFVRKLLSCARYNTGMAGLEDRLRGDKKENYVGDSDSDHHEEEAEVPPDVHLPVSDGLPQVRAWLYTVERGNCTGSAGLISLVRLTSGKSCCVLWVFHCNTG